MLPETEANLFTTPLLARVQLFNATASKSEWLLTQDDQARTARQLATTAHAALEALHAHLGECWEKSHPKRGAALMAAPAVAQDEPDELAGPAGVTTVENAYRGRKRGRKTNAEREAIAAGVGEGVEVMIPADVAEEVEG